MHYTKYDDKISRQAASMLYARAAEIVNAAVIQGALIGLVIGGILGLLYAGMEADFGSSPNLIYAMAGGIVGAGIRATMGYYQAQNTAFLYKFYAQQILVLVQIEENTRSGNSNRSNNNSSRPTTTSSYPSPSKKSSGGLGSKLGSFDPPSDG